MSYLVLARKYRPTSFEGVSGQEHVTRTLCNAIRRNKVGHAFLFTGPRGVGKTSIARIFARALNCSEGKPGVPCLQCSSCKEIAHGTSMAVREIDGASHNSVDHVRELIDSFRSPPPPNYRYKIYIIDEVHMLSTAAFNALLKSLEEPPPFTIFILATTEVHKIPETVISRCHRHDFRALSVEEIARQLRYIGEQENIDIEDEAVRMLARLADGSMRDAQSLLDRVQSFAEARLTAADVSAVLGIVERGVLSDLMSRILAKDAGGAIELLHRSLGSGLDIGLFLREFVAFWREMLIARFLGGAGLKAVGISESDAARLQELVSSVGEHDLQDLVHLSREGADMALRSSQPKYALEALIIRLATRERVVEISSVLHRVRGALTGDAAGSSRLAAPRTAAARPEPTAPPVSSVSRQVSRPSAPATAAKREAAAAEPESGEVSFASIAWEDFVRAVDKGGAKILTEHLRRLSVQIFANGTLKAQGPDFSIDYIKLPDTTAKLRQRLGEATGNPNWKLDLTGTGAHQPAEPGSLHHKEKLAHTQYVAGKKEDLANHPKVKSLQKFFPGSQIENIKVHKP